METICVGLARGCDPCERRCGRDDVGVRIHGDRPVYRSHNARRSCIRFDAGANAGSCVVDGDDSRGLCVRVAVTVGGALRARAVAGRVIGSGPVHLRSE